MKRSLLALSTVLAVACGPAAETSVEVGTRSDELTVKVAKAQPAAVALRATDAKASSPTFKTTFSAYSTYDVYFAADVGALKGTHKLAIELLMPNGLPYQRMG
jgi:hypothetical protein